MRAAFAFDVDYSEQTHFKARVSVYYDKRWQDARSAALVLLFYRHHGFGFPVGTVIRPLTAAGAGAVCGRLLYGLLGVGTANFLVSAAVMGAVYVVLAFLIKAVDPKTLRKK